MTFLYETVDAVRGAIGRERILGIRMYDDLEDWGLQLDDYKQVARLLEAHGKVDYFNMWQGIVPSPRSGRRPLARALLRPRRVRAPAARDQGGRVAAGGRDRPPRLAGRRGAVHRGRRRGPRRDGAGAHRRPTPAEQGPGGPHRRHPNLHRVHPELASGTSTWGWGWGCIYNPVTGREGQWAALPPAAERRRVVVVGGGPAGLEAARIAAERGHEVVLFERGARLGGQVNLVMRTPARDSFEEIILFFERQLDRLGVDVRLRTEAGAGDVLAERPDAVVVATGSSAFRPEVIGRDKRHVLTAREVIQGNAAIGESVLVVDTLGRAEAPTVAELIADMGRKVEVVTGLAYVGCEMPIPAWHNLMERLLEKNVTLTPFTGVWEIEDGSVEVYNVISWQPRTMEGIDTVVFAAGGVAEDGLGAALAGRVAEVHVIGDCYQPRDIRGRGRRRAPRGPGDRRRSRDNESAEDGLSDREEVVSACSSRWVSRC